MKSINEVKGFYSSADEDGNDERNVILSCQRSASKRRQFHDPVKMKPSHLVQPMNQ